jgi:hypothetical protein
MRTHSGDSGAGEMPVYYFQYQAGDIQGPFSAVKMASWFRRKYLPLDLMVREGEQPAPFQCLRDAKLAFLRLADTSTDPVLSVASVSNASVSTAPGSAAVPLVPAQGKPVGLDPVVTRSPHPSSPVSVSSSTSLCQDHMMVDDDSDGDGDGNIPVSSRSSSSLPAHVPSPRPSPTVPTLVPVAAHAVTAGNTSLLPLPLPVPPMGTLDIPASALATTAAMVVCADESGEYDVNGDVDDGDDNDEDVCMVRPQPVESQKERLDTPLLPQLSPPSQ